MLIYVDDMGYGDLGCSSNPDTRKREPVMTDDPPSLFDLAGDLGEQKNIAADHSEIVSRLLDELAALRESN